MCSSDLTPPSPIPAGTTLFTGNSPLSASFNILALRQAEALQKYREITQSVDTKYRDYWKRDNLFSLRYCNWNKDMFIGILPNSQFGDIAVVDVSGSTGYSNVRIGTSGIFVQNFAEINSDSSFLVKPSSTPSSPVSAGTNLIAGNSSLSASFNILALRQAEALQKYREITQSVDINLS